MLPEADRAHGNASVARRDELEDVLGGRDALKVAM
jgi:hypothetical protein